jgi:hypothetical protein
MQVRNLRVELEDQPITEYRLDEGNLEFRLLDPSGRLYEDWRSDWRRLRQMILHCTSDLTPSLVNGLKTRWVTGNTRSDASLRLESQ